MPLARPRWSAALAGPPGVRGALWRSLAMFRAVSLGYALAHGSTRVGSAPRPALGVALLVVMVVWSLAAGVALPATDRARPLLARALAAVDLSVCVLLVLGAAAVGPRPDHAVSMVGAVSGVFAVAISWGTVGGLAAAVVEAGAFLVEHPTVGEAFGRTTAQEVLAGVVAGYLSRAAAAAETELAAARAARAADEQRARIARDVHDGVLQVLALITREAPRGLAPSTIARLAAEQESALRDLVRVPVATAPAEAPGDAEEADLAAALVRLAHEVRDPVTTEPRAVTVATPGTPVPLAARRAHEVTGAVRAALDNVARHAGPGASAWVLVEDEGDEIVVTVRDDGVGIAPGRAEQAETDGRLGLAESIRGRIGALGGAVTVHSRPGKGTEVELRVPR